MSGPVATPSSVGTPGGGGKRAGRRLAHPSSEVLKKWLYAHSDNPYPTSEEKEELQRLTGLTRMQLDAWLTNGRQRYVKPKERRGANPNYARYSKDVRDILVEWLVNHVKHPYPKNDEMADLMKKTKLTKRQIQNWMTNSRKRKLIDRMAADGKFMHDDDSLPAPSPRNPTSFSSGSSPSSLASTQTPGMLGFQSATTPLPKPFSFQIPTPAASSSSSSPNMVSPFMAARSNNAGNDAMSNAMSSSVNASSSSSSSSTSPSLSASVSALGAVPNNANPSKDKRSKKGLELNIRPKGHNFSKLTVDTSAASLTPTANGKIFFSPSQATDSFFNGPMDMIPSPHAIPSPINNINANCSLEIPPHSPQGGIENVASRLMRRQNAPIQTSQQLSMDRQQGGRHQQQQTDDDSPSQSFNPSQLFRRVNYCASLKRFCERWLGHQREHKLAYA
ncbi:Homeobox protein 4 [Hondaea fermentalgiana]|uniref:Homeobox protein 4 n=1 Tax=Hondaea fermentalgiana TaxID=2315210 RepID=A0A2R5GNZ4_9STRA|nr:Homeobox protein 4 [Hondaea fermentalgiana]|eukprot:GBG30353.1 Homeobox protein 4 [Hondaea fermentalgiana]